MSKSTPDHHDADLVIKFYDLRREPVMRESRDAINREFWPADERAALALLDLEHPLNRAYRQTSTYWEMVYGTARHGIVHGDYLLENSGEGLLLFAKVEPYLAAIRKAQHPGVFVNAEWIAGSSDYARSVLQRMQKRVSARLGR